MSSFDLSLGIEIGKTTFWCYSVTKRSVAETERMESLMPMRCNTLQFSLTWHIPVNQDLVQTLGNQVLDQQAVVSPNGLDSFGVHFVVLIRVRPQQPRVSLLADEQVGAVDLLELELDGLRKEERIGLALG